MSSIKLCLKRLNSLDCACLVGFVSQNLDTIINLMVHIQSVDKYKNKSWSDRKVQSWGLFVYINKWKLGQKWAKNRLLERQQGKIRQLLESFVSASSVLYIDYDNFGTFCFYSVSFLLLSAKDITIVVSDVWHTHCNLVLFTLFLIAAWYNYCFLLCFRTVAQEKKSHFFVSFLSLTCSPRRLFS